MAGVGAASATLVLLLGFGEALGLALAFALVFALGAALGVGPAPDAAKAAEELASGAALAEGNAAGWFFAGA